MQYDCTSIAIMFLLFYSWQITLKRIMELSPKEYLAETFLGTVAVIETLAENIYLMKSFDEKENKVIGN